MRGSHNKSNVHSRPPAPLAAPLQTKKKAPKHSIQKTRFHVLAPTQTHTNTLSPSPPRLSLSRSLSLSPSLSLSLSLSLALGITIHLRHVYWHRQALHANPDTASAEAMPTSAPRMICPRTTQYASPLCAVPAAVAQVPSPRAGRPCQCDPSSVFDSLASSSCLSVGPRRTKRGERTYRPRHRRWPR